MAIASRRPKQPQGVQLQLAEDAWHGHFQAMGSPCELVCESPRRHIASELCELVAIEARRIESKFSRYLGGSITSQLNSAAGADIEVDEETADLLDFAARLYNLSGRRFDVTSGILRKAWRFDGGDRIPGDAEVKELLQLVGWHKVDWHRPILRMPAGMEIDLGGIGKEYAVDRCAALLREQGTSPCLVNFGGDLAASDAPKRRRSWKVAIEGELADAGSHVIGLRRGALATSGDARRFLQKNGVRYSHILDPVTGWPVPDAPRSITIMADTCVEAGMLSTLAILKGSGAEDFLKAQSAKFWCRR